MSDLDTTVPQESTGEGEAPEFDWNAAAGPAGEWRADPAGRHEFRYFVGDTPSDLVSDQEAESLDEYGEWRADPVGRHEARYFVAGEPTLRVSDAGIATVEKAATAASRRPRALWIAVAVAAVAMVVAGVLGSQLSAANDKVDDYQAAEARAAAAVAALPDLGEMADDAFAGVSGVSVSGDEESANIQLFYPYPGSDDMDALEGLLDDLGFSSGTIQRIEQTAPIDGAVTAEGDQDVTATWTYDSDYGLDVVVERPSSPSA
jgi:hypothetical protein